MISAYIVLCIWRVVSYSVFVSKLFYRSTFIIIIATEGANSQFQIPDSCDIPSESGHDFHDHHGHDSHDHRTLLVAGGGADSGHDHEHMCDSVCTKAKGQVYSYVCVCIRYCKLNIPCQV